ncbi:polyketide cyclase/dehydrase and lipid transport [Leptospira perolatii]|uniref:Polyketide cyclase/dehydrase and lipid transport n=1 Tax=Leptospira perolatii TaxID=2023191 RepID=A0A2M9ZLX1_9LEPT|nr:SRPBCC family protein [Leptospira perolatii]PJZ69168.1 polyketide cyclase/dehydrase and lipid transport [Leptospira perolatii]PJZ73088.1 polyketide cyclase/dehydrase and lipid transport [Leptospira perolatii]
MFWLLVTSITFLGAMLVMLVIGMVLPESHEAEAEKEVEASIEQVYAELRNPEEYPRWKSGVRSVLKESDTVWLEKDSHGNHVRYMIAEESRPNRIVIRILTEGLPYQGEWEYELQKLGPRKTRIRLKEKGRVKNPIFRFLSKFFFGHSATIHHNLKELAGRLEPS